MTAYEIIASIIGILGLLFAFGTFIIALLAYIESRNKRK